jgi:magnesium transporter
MKKRNVKCPFHLFQRNPGSKWMSNCFTSAILVNKKADFMREQSPSNQFFVVSKKTGLPPGSLVFVGDTSTCTTEISEISYNLDHYSEKKVDNIKESILCTSKQSGIKWINVCGFSDINTIQEIGEKLNIHPLTLEDILNTNQRPKVEIFDHYIFVVLKKIANISDLQQIEYEQLSILIGKDYVITFEETNDQHIEKVKTRIEKGSGQIRKSGADYLAYALIDSIVDQYFKLQESFDDYIESLENELLLTPSAETLNNIHRLKREIIFLRKSISSISDLMTVIIREDSTLISPIVKVYYRDVLDHVIRLHESIDSYRELLSGMLNIYLSVLSNKTNEVMRILTVLASIFIPLTFIAGIYGMNFDYMPELRWKWSYPTLLIVFIVIIIISLFIFKRKKWL